MFVDLEEARDIALTLIGRYQYSRFRNHKIFSENESRQVHLDDFLYSSGSDVLFFAVEAIRGVLGILKVSRADWDSSHFDFPMYRIAFIHCEGFSKECGDVERAIATVLASLRKGHVLAEVDHNDYLWLNALINSGFRLNDSKSNYVFRRHQRPVSLRVPFVCRDFRSEDMGAVMDILNRTSFHSKFSRDPFFYQLEGKVKEMYEAWVVGLVLRECSDAPVLVVERSGVVVGFGAGRRMDLPLSANGKVVCGNSLFFCRADAAGSYPSLVHYLTGHTKKFFDALELSASITNYSAIRVLERLGLRLACGSHSLSIQVDV